MIDALGGLYFILAELVFLITLLDTARQPKPRPRPVRPVPYPRDADDDTLMFPVVLGPRPRKLSPHQEAVAYWAAQAWATVGPPPRQPADLADILAANKRTFEAGAT